MTVRCGRLGVVPRTAWSGTTASRGDCVLRSATRIPIAPPFWPETPVAAAHARQLKVVAETEAAHDFDGGLATALVGRVSPRPQDRGRNCNLLGREPSREAKAFGLAGRWVAVDPAVSERHALPERSPDHDLKLTPMGSRRTATIDVPGVPGTPGAPNQSPSPSASDLPDAGLLHPYEPAPATFDGNLRKRACAWHRIPYESRCSVALARDQGCPMDS